MTTLAVAGSTGGPEQALPAAARAQLTADSRDTRSAVSTKLPPAVALPRTPVGTQLSWLLGEFNGGSATITPMELRSHLNRHFLTMVPPRAFVRLLRASDLRGSAVVTGIAEHASPRAITAIVATPADGEYLVRVTVEARSQHLITSLSIDALRASTR